MMPGDNTTGGMSKQNLEDFRSLQAEMLRLSQEYSQARLAVWAEETRSLSENWDSFSREWQGTVEQMTALAGTKFDELAALGEAAGSRLAQSWEQNLTDLSGQVDDWGEHFLEVLAKVAESWAGAMGGGNTGGWSSFLSAALGFGGWFHQGGLVTAHQGLVIAPETLLGDEQLVVAQAGEGILPRESMARLGEQNFEALRSGRFAVGPGGAGSRYEITIQVQSLDAAGVAGLDWDRLVQRHLLPALQKEAAQRW
jgi:hypothetical protein